MKNGKKESAERQIGKQNWRKKEWQNQVQC